MGPYYAGLGDTTASSSTAVTTAPLTVAPASTSAAAAATSALGFTDGLKLWTQPSVAMSLLPNISSMASSAPVGFVLGFLAVPLGVVGVVLYMMSKK